jgi:hypothetical protein
VRGRCNGRSCTHSSGSEMLVPLSPTHRPNACTRRHYKKLIVTSVFNICRPGDAVVSGWQETGRHRLSPEVMRRFQMDLSYTILRLDEHAGRRWILPTGWDAYSLDEQCERHNRYAAEHCGSDSLVHSHSTVFRLQHGAVSCCPRWTTSREWRWRRSCSPHERCGTPSACGRT